jgi:hypothetical protein
MKVIYTYSIRDNEESILASFWLLTTNDKLTLWSSLPHSIFQFKKQELMPEPLVWEEIEQALDILFQIIDWVKINNYHICFAFHHSVSQINRESFYFALDYRAIYHHPQIAFCNNTINDFHFKRFYDEYTASLISTPKLFKEQTEETTREAFELYLKDADDNIKSWYIEHYHILNTFILDINEEVHCVYSFSDEELKCVAFKN